MVSPPIMYPNYKYLHTKRYGEYKRMSLKVCVTKIMCRSVILYEKKYGCNDTCSFQNNIAINRYFMEKGIAVIIYLQNSIPTNNVSKL